MGFRGEIDKGVKAAFENIGDRFGIADVAANKVVTRIGGQVAEALRVSGVGQLVEIDDVNIATSAQNVSNEIRADESCPARHQEFQSNSPSAGLETRPSEHCTEGGYSQLRECRGGLPRPGTLLAPVSETKLVARCRDSNVPASVHQPSRMLCVSVRSRRYILFTSVISSSLRQLGLALPILSNTVAS